MGICSSEPEKTQTPVYKEASENGGGNSGNGLAMGDVKVSLDEGRGSGVALQRGTDFKLALRDVTLLILTRMSKALMYEKDSYQEIAKKMGKSNYMDLMAYKKFEAALRSVFTPGPEQPNRLPKSDINYAHRGFTNLLEACKNATPPDSEKQMILTLQSAASEAQTFLEKGVGLAQASDLKFHLLFFINSLNVIQGNIYDDPQLLVKKMLVLCESRPVDKN